MKAEKLDGFQISKDDTVKVTEMGNVTEVLYLQKRNTICNIRKLDSDRYVNLDTGEVKEYQHTENRGQNLKEVKQSLRRLREYLNTNIEDVEKCLWVTLTYRENMTDTERLYKDYDKFIKRLRYHCKKENMGKVEYIEVVEPQGRGAWHCHAVLIFDHKKPYIANKTLSSLWGHGFVSVKKLDNVDNVGAYITAYLGDMELKEYKNMVGELPEENRIKEIDLNLGNGEKVKKKFVKGARLCLYPPGMNLYRTSKGIKKPRSCLKKYGDIEKDSLGGLTFSKTLSINDDAKDFEQVISYEYYNKKR